MNLNDVQFNPRDNGAVNYARARYAIEENLPNRKTKRDAKMVVINHLQGALDHHLVTFPDGSKAKF